MSSQAPEQSNQWPGRLGYNPAVSVIIPAYNTADYICEVLDSVFAQTFSDFQVIVVNDGSPDTDRFERAIRPYSDRIEYLEQENRGPGAARNSGIRCAHGEFIAFLDSDDSWLPDYLASQMKLFEETPSLDMVYSDASLYGDPELSGRTFMQVCPSTGAVTFESLLKEDCQVITSAAVVRRQVIIDAGLFDESESFIGVEDYDLWLRISYGGRKIAYQQKVLARHRSTPGSLSSRSTNMIAAQVQVLAKLERTLQLSAEMRSLLQERLGRARAYFELERGKQHLFAREFEQAGDSLRRANAFFHSTKLRLVLLGVRIAPRLTGFVVRNRERLQSWPRNFKGLLTGDSKQSR